MTDRHARLAALAALPTELSAAVAGLDADTLTARPVPGEWSVAQNVHHVFDSHVNAYVRFKLIVTEPGPVLKPYDEAAWGALPDGSYADISGSLTMLTALHERWSRFLHGMTDEQWARTGYHPANAKLMSADDLLELYVGHGRAHIQQLGEVLAAL